MLLSGCGAILALGATGGLGGGLGFGGEGVPLSEGDSLGGGGLGAGTGAGVLDETASITDCGFGVMEGFSVVFPGWSSKLGADFVVPEADGSEAILSFGSISADEVSVVSALLGSVGAAVKPPSSQNTLLDGLGPGGKFLGFGAITGGTDLAGCPWRRGRGRGSGLSETTNPSTASLCLLLSPQLPSPICCSKACILAFRVAMSSPSSSSLSDWLSSLLSLR